MKKYVILFLLIATMVTLYDARKGKIRKDFTLFSLNASRVMYKGGNPYSEEEVGKKYKYFPLNAALLLPFTPLPDALAQGLWFALNACLFLYTFDLIQRMNGQKISPMVWLLILGLGARFIWENLKMGQWNAPTLTLAVIGYYHLRKRPVGGASLLGLAACLKFMPLVFLVLLATRREWKSLALTFGFIFFWLLIVPSILLGPRRHVEVLGGYRQKLHTERVPDMLGGNAAKGFSLQAKLTSILSPVLTDDGDQYRTINIFNLPDKVARGLAWAVCGLLVLAAIVISIKSSGQGAGDDDFIRLGQAGMWMCMWLLASPEARQPQFLWMSPGIFFLGALGFRRGYSGVQTYVGRAAIISGYVIVLAFSNILDKAAHLNRLTSAWGAQTLLALIIFTGCAWSIWCLSSDQAKPAAERKTPPALTI